MEVREALCKIYKFLNVVAERRLRIFNYHPTSDRNCNVYEFVFIIINWFFNITARMERNYTFLLHIPRSNCNEFFTYSFDQTKVQYFYWNIFYIEWCIELALFAPLQKNSVTFFINYSFKVYCKNQSGKKIISGLVFIENNNFFTCE